MNTLTKLDAILSRGLPSDVAYGLAHSSSLNLAAQAQPAPLASSSVTTLPPSSHSNGLRTIVPRPRRRRRRPPTGSSIKLPPPTTPLLLRVALALWSILLSFWVALVGDTRATRVLRRQRRTRVSPATANTKPDASASSDDGSGSEVEADWVDPVTRAPDVPTTPEPEFRPRTPTDTTFSFRLRSAQKKDAVSISGTLDPSVVPNTAERDQRDAPLQTQMVKVENGAAPATPRRARLLPNPMQTSLLDPSVPAVPHRNIAIPPVPRIHQTPFHLQKTLILDLDETLIHSTSRPIGSAHAGGGLLGVGSGLFGRKARREGHTVEVVLNGRSTLYHVYKRPYVDFFLKKVASWYTLVIYTASMPEYADPVIDWLDNGRGLFAKRLYRESCFLQNNGSYIKDLALVERDLGRVCFMDNSPISYSWNKANALPIEGWTSDPNDEALLHSIPVLDSLRFVTDVRRILGIRGFA